MFLNCKNITEIDMLNWNLNNLKVRINLPNWNYNLSNSNYNNFNSLIGTMLSNNYSMLGHCFKGFQKEIINRLFSGCKNLRIIKLNTNFDEIIINENTILFDGIPDNGTFIYKKGMKYNNLLNKLPSSWNRIEE